MRLLPHRTRLLAHKKLLGILALLFALAGVLQPLEAHNASIAACKKLADSGWGKNERAVWNKICESKDADLSKTSENCKAEGVGSESDNNNCKGSLKAGFLHDILFQKCYRDVIGPRGVHIKNAKFAEVDLSWGKIPWPLRLDSCSFQSLSMSRLVAEREIVLTDSEISGCLNLQSASIQRDLILKNLKIKNGSANLTAARIGGNLSMANTHFRDLDLSFASVGARFDGNAFANISRQPATGSLIQNHIEHMLASPEMTASSGVTAKGTLTAKGDLIMSGASITGKADLRGTQVNGRLHLWKSAKKKNEEEKSTKEKPYKLHGLTYDEVVPQNNGKSNEEILDELKIWLDKDESRSVQPYMYLASRLRAKNNFYISEQVLLAGKKSLTGSDDKNEVSNEKDEWYPVSFFYEDVLDNLLFMLVICIKEAFYSPTFMFGVLVVLIAAFFVVLVLNYITENSQPWKKTWEAIFSPVLLLWKKIMLSQKTHPPGEAPSGKASPGEATPGKASPGETTSGKDWAKVLLRLISLIGKSSLIIILVRMILPVGIDILSIFF